VSFLDRILGRGRGSAGRQEGDPTVLDRPDDPRGGVQSEAYRHADPRDVVESGGTTMAGPAGTPQTGESVDERRERDER
jgi:hypothetical protein